MPLVNCQKCGKVFFCTGGRPICPECNELDSADFQKVRDFVKENLKVPIDIVSEETGVPAEKIRQYLHDGLLEEAQSTEEFKCQLCGKSIDTGNYCFTCMNKLKKGFSKGSDKKEKKKETKSFTQSYIDKKR